MALAPEGEASSVQPPLTDHGDNIPLWDAELRAMKLQLQGVMQNIQHKPSVTANSPFVASIRDKPLPAKFKMPTIDSFDGTTDLVDHLETYRTLMILHAFPDEIMCRAFPVTLKGSARLWFSQLPADSVSTFQHLSLTNVKELSGWASLTLGSDKMAQERVTEVLKGGDGIRR